MGNPRDSARAVSAAYRSLVGEDASKLDIAKEKKQREWIWEYVLKFCPEQSIIRELVKVFPFPDDSLVLKRMLLLKTLAFHLAEALLPERALDVLRGLVDLDVGQPPGNDLLLAVMVELTVQHLREESLDSERFSEAFEKHWGPSVQDTEDRYQDDVGALETTRQEFRAVLEKDNFREVVVRRYPRELMKRMLTGYLDQSWAEIGPTFLENAEEENRDASAQGNQTGTPVNNVTEEVTHADNQGPVDEQRMADAVSPNCDHGADTDPSGVVEAIRDLREREKHLYKAVKDPLANALLLASQVQGMVQAARRNETGREDAQQKGSDGEMNIGSKVPNGQPNCIEEDISSPEEGISKPSRRTMLQRPTQSHFSPLSPFDSPPHVKARRRMRNIWTDTEEKTLRSEVAKYGKGRWKFILMNNIDVFTNRTEVDLKDKWRNIERSGG